ncbi:unnamed protein product, partial [Linum tenue]
ILHSHKIKEIVAKSNISPLHSENPKERSSRTPQHNVMGAQRIPNFDIISRGNALCTIPVAIPEVPNISHSKKFLFVAAFELQESLQELFICLVNLHQDQTRFRPVTELDSVSNRHAISSRQGLPATTESFLKALPS